MALTFQKNPLIPALLLGAIGYASFAQAHIVNGVLGASPSATDIYAVTCDEGNGPLAKLEVKVMDLRPKRIPLITATVSAEGSDSQSTTDPIDGDERYSPLLNFTLPQGVTTVTLSVSKTAPLGKDATKGRRGIEKYRLEYHCITVDGIEAKSRNKVKQNQ